MVERSPRSPSKRGHWASLERGILDPNNTPTNSLPIEGMAPGRCPIARAELHSRAVARRYHVGAANVAAPQLPRLLPPAAALASLHLPRYPSSLDCSYLPLYFPGTSATTAPVPLPRFASGARSWRSEPADPWPFFGCWQVHFWLGALLCCPGLRCRPGSTFFTPGEASSPR